MSSNAIYSFSSESDAAQLGGYFGIGLFLLMGTGLFFAGNWPAFILGLSFWSLSFFLLRIFVKEVNFYEDRVVLVYLLFQKTIEIPYVQIRTVQPKDLPKFGLLYLAIIKDKKPIRKFTWVCTKEEFEVLKVFLRKQQVRVLREE